MAEHAFSACGWFRSVRDGHFDWPRRRGSNLCVCRHNDGLVASTHWNVVLCQMKGAARNRRPRANMARCGTMDSHRGDLRAFDYRRTASPDLVARGLALAGRPLGSNVWPNLTLAAEWRGH